MQDIQSLTDYYTKIKLFVTNTILLQIYHHVDVKLLRNGMVGPKLEALAISHGLEWKWRCIEGKIETGQTSQKNKQCSFY